MKYDRGHQNPSFHRDNMNFSLHPGQQVLAAPCSYLTLPEILRRLSGVISTAAMMDLTSRRQKTYNCFNRTILQLLQKSKQMVTVMDFCNCSEFQIPAG